MKLATPIPSILMCAATLASAKAHPSSSPPVVPCKDVALHQAWSCAELSYGTLVSVVGPEETDRVAGYLEEGARRFAFHFGDPPPYLFGIGIADEELEKAKARTQAALIYDWDSEADLLAQNNEARLLSLTMQLQQKQLTAKETAEAVEKERASLPDHLPEGLRTTFAIAAAHEIAHS